MAPITPTESGAVALELPQTGHKSLDVNALTKFLLGPLVAIMLWALPLGIDPTARKAFAVVGFMIVLWILEPISHAVTALIGCYLFWVLDVAKFSVAFSGFASTTPWILFGGLLIGEASSRTGLAKRLGYVILRKTGTSYSRLLLGVIILSFLINFLVPAGPARVSVIAPILVGILAAFNFSNRGNAAKGLFLVMSYTSVLFDKMIMSGASALLTRGIIEEVAGASVFWSQWFFAFLPATVLTILACWVTIQWFYPGEKKELPESREYFHNSLAEMGPLSGEEKKVLFWTLLAVGLWASDSIHHANPAMIGIGAGLILALPRLGVLDTHAVRQVNFLVVVFCAGALSLGSVVIQTKGFDVFSKEVVNYISPLLANGLYSSILLYWGGILYHMFIADNPSMLSTSLPLLLQATEGMSNNPIALGLVWSFAGGANLFVYQSSVLVLGYSYGYFEGKDLLKVSIVLTIVEGILLMILVPFYWPLIGLNWLK